MLYIEDLTVTVKCKTATKLFFTLICVGLVVWFMVFNTTFNNILVISWQSVLLVEEPGVARENH
jgi:hypothetical protein